MKSSPEIQQCWQNPQRLLSLGAKHDKMEKIELWVVNVTEIQITKHGLPNSQNIGRHNCEQMTLQNARGMAKVASKIMYFSVAMQLSWHFVFCFSDFRSLLSVIWPELWASGAPPTCDGKTAAAEKTKRQSVSTMPILIETKEDEAHAKQRALLQMVMMVKRVQTRGDCDWGRPAFTSQVQPGSSLRWELHLFYSCFIPQAHTRCSIKMYWMHFGYYSRFVDRDTVRFLLISKETLQHPKFQSVT